MNTTIKAEELGTGEVNLTLSVGIVVKDWETSAGFLKKMKEEINLVEVKRK